jgi:hypothetical protein
MKQLLQITILSLLMAFLSCSNGINSAYNNENSVDIESFSLNGFSGSIIGNKIYVTLPKDTDMSQLVAHFYIDGDYVKVDNNLQINGISKNDFSNPVTYTVYNNKGVWKKYEIIAAPATWQKAYGGSGDEEANAIAATSDGGYILTGYTTSNDEMVSGNHGGKDIWVLKVNRAGHVEWQKCFGGSGDDVGNSIQRTRDGGYIIAGYTESPDGSGDVIGNNGGRDVWIIKIDPYGEFEWKNCYGGSGDDEANHIQQTHDGGFITIGSTNSDDLAGYYDKDDIIVVKLDLYGNEEWKKLYGGTNTDTGSRIRTKPGGGFVIIGNTKSNDNDVTVTGGSTDAWIAEINSNGDKQRDLRLGGILLDQGKDILITNDDNYLAIGIDRINYVFDGSSYYRDQILISKVSTSGKELVELNSISYHNGFLANSTEGLNIIKQPGGCFMIAGNYKPNSTSDIVLLKIDDAGNEVNYNTYTGDDTEFGREILSTPDGGVIIAGSTNSTSGDIKATYGGYDFLLMKVNSSGDL